MVQQVIDQVPRIQFTATAGQTIFPYGFLILVKTDITVEQNGTPLVVDVGFTVSGVGVITGGNVTLTSGATVGDIITVYRSQGFDRQVDFQESGDFLSATVNGDMNRTILMLQQNREELARSLQYPIDDIVGTNLLPVKADRLNKFLGFDVNGNPTALDNLINTTSADTVSSIALLKALSASDGDSVLVTGYYVDSDGGGGHYQFDSSSAVADNGGTIIAPNVGSGRWILNVPGSLSPLQFGAVGDNVTDDSGAFQAMYDYLDDNDLAIPIFVPPRIYYHLTSVDLPQNLTVRHYAISGYGATIRTDQAIDMWKRIPADQTAALLVISKSAPVVLGITFIGDSTTDQNGLNIGATYTAAVVDCSFVTLDRGLIYTFCLHGQIVRARFTNCVFRPLIIRSAGDDGEGGGAVWTGATIAASASNAARVTGTRVFGAAGHDASYNIFGSDMVILDNCISEGDHDNFDLQYDFQSNSSVNNFVIRNFWCEAPGAVLNFKIAGKGGVLIDGAQRIFPAAFLDASGSSSAVVFRIKNTSFWSNMPTGADPNNPNARWFYHTNGGGYNGVESGTSTGTAFEFELGEILNSTEFLDANNWEDATLPLVMSVKGFRGANGGAFWEAIGQMNIEAPTVAIESQSANVFITAATKVTLKSNNGDVEIDPSSSTFGAKITGRIKANDAITGFTTLGSVAGKIAIYNTSGTLIGFAPLYDAITT